MTRTCLIARAVVLAAAVIVAVNFVLELAS